MRWDFQARAPAKVSTVGVGCGCNCCRQCQFSNCCDAAGKFFNEFRAWLSLRWLGDSHAFRSGFSQGRNDLRTKGSSQIAERSNNEMGGIDIRRWRHGSTSGLEKIRNVHKSTHARARSRKQNGMMHCWCYLFQPSITVLSRSR